MLPVEFRHVLGVMSRFVCFAPFVCDKQVVIVHLYVLVGGVSYRQQRADGKPVLR